MSRPVSSFRITAATALVLLAARLGLTGSQADPEDPTARLEVAMVRGDNGRTTPARVYLFKDDKPFRLSPADVLLPLRVDLFYRERLWRRPADPGRPRTAPGAGSKTGRGGTHPRGRAAAVALRLVACVRWLRGAWTTSAALNP